ncbi:MAG: hypothetical protein JST70_10560 [Bacteroidetes bacterium]|nr:hypothetical protein [Bacteroidota bacterium]
MNLKSIFRNVLYLIFTLASFSSNAQWQGFVRGALSDEDGSKWYDQSRMELCVSYPLPQAFIETQYEVFDPETQTVSMSKKTLHTLTVSKAWGAGVSMSFPLTSGKKTCLAISSAFMGNVFTLSPSKPILISPNKYFSPLSYTCIYFPVSLDFKYGADAIYTRNLKSMFNIGFGAYPYICESSRQSGYIGVTPFVKAEFGFFAGIAMKIRATCSLKSMNYDEDGSYEIPTQYHNSYGNIVRSPDIQGTYTIQGSPDLILSLVILPFSRKWSYDY